MKDKENMPEILLDKSDNEQNSGINVQKMKRDIEVLKDLVKRHEKENDRHSNQIKELSKIVERLNSEFPECEKADNEIYVGNIDPDLRPKDLETYFSKFGTVVDAFFLRSHRTSQCGIVKFANKKSPEEAIKTKKHSIQGRELFVMESRGKRFQGGRRRQGPFHSDVLKAKAEKFSGSSRRYCPY